MLKKETRGHIRWAIRRDLESMLDLESITKDPLTEDDILNNLRQRNVIAKVLEIREYSQKPADYYTHGDEEIAGYMIYSLHKEFLVLERLIVDPKHRKKGFGKQMIEKLIGKLSHHRRIYIEANFYEEYLEVGAFLKKCGFVVGSHVDEEITMYYELEPEKEN